ncbi:MAG: proton-conducting transporter membrane subunit [Thermodesulfobacteriota bacterium]|nr:proton-conducting transporter membrane subunit [Thermodesulfobacteriota bacterium]
MTANVLLTPGLLLIATGLLLSTVSGWRQRLLVLLLPPVAMWQLWSLTFDNGWNAHVAGFSLQLLHLTSAGRLFACAFIIALWLGGMFALNSASRSELASAFVYAGSAISVTLCGDLISLFIFWELMAISSTLVIWAARTTQSWHAGLRYLLIHLAGGVLLLSGIAGLAVGGSDLSMGLIQSDGLARWLIFAGFLVNAGAPPFSYWIADAYPTSSPTGMVFLAAFTTKTAVYVLISYFAGETLLIPIGLYMAIYGVIYALRENNIRRILAYSIVNQVGFMITAVGIGSTTAINGATAHAFAHILYKTVLLMGAGSVLLSVGKEKCCELGQLAHKMPWTTACVVIGAAASMGVPLTSSFITKSLILQSAAEQHLSWVWLILTACSAAVVFNAGIRFPYLTYFQPRQSTAIEHGRDPDNVARLAMLLGACLCVAVGVFPQQFYTLLPNVAIYHPYTLAHIIEQLQLLIPAALIFFITLPLLTPQQRIQLDWDWFLRRPLLVGWQDIILHLFSVGLHSRDFIVTALIRGFKFIFRHYGPRGILSRSWPTGNIALWVAFILASYVALYSLQNHNFATYIHRYIGGG